VILLDTHIWIWWVDGSNWLKRQHRQRLESGDELGLSVISCWEVAKLVEKGNVKLRVALDEWMAQALTYPRIKLLDLTPEIAIASTQLPGSFHPDPADQIIVATARYYNCELMTVDSKILQYPHVKTL